MLYYHSTLETPNRKENTHVVRLHVPGSRHEVHRGLDGRRGAREGVGRAHQVQRRPRRPRPHRHRDRLNQGLSRPSAPRYVSGPSGFFLFSNPLTILAKQDAPKLRQKIRHRYTP